MASDFSGKTAIVTGAARGLGLAIARRFAAAGARVVAADLNPPPPDEFLFRRADVSCEDSVRALMDFAAAETGGIDVLVNNAGIVLEESIARTETADWERVFAVNARGVFLCAKHARPGLRRRGGGAIVNIGSIEANAANPLHAAYAASKGAVHSLTRNIALEYGADNIRCNAVAPGWMDTPLNDNYLAQFADPAAARAAIHALHPVGRIGAPDDIAAVVLWLAGDDAGFATGQIYVHDGGRTARLPLPPL